MVCVHPTPRSTRRRLGQFQPEADGQDHDGSGDQPRHYQPVRNRPRSPALNAAQRVLPIPFGLIEETKRDVVGHRATRQQVKSPAGIILSHCYRLTHQRSIKQTIVFERVGSIYLWQTLSWAMQEFPHGPSCQVAAALSLCDSTAGIRSSLQSSLLARVAIGMESLDADMTSTWIYPVDKSLERALSAALSEANQPSMRLSAGRPNPATSSTGGRGR
jgi:hypothetical protein